MMASQRCQLVWTALVALLDVIYRTTASPTVAFPFNSQVPVVARINQPYSFQLSESTFAPDPDGLVYTLSDQPAWLTIESATRTLSGTPGQGDVGDINFLVTAADSSGAAIMSCTLVVSADPAPQLEGDISKDIATTANLSSSQPPIVTVLPSTPFSFQFQQDSFIDIIQRKLYYYATLTDHTPLPAWLLFDATKLVFSGTAPVLSAFPQSWSIDLIASDVVGFAGTAASFIVTVGTEQLAFFPQEQEVNVTTGVEMTFTALRNQLYRDGMQIGLPQIASAQASMPSWMQFNVSTLDLSGIPPSSLVMESVSVTVTDGQGGTAIAVVDVVANGVSNTTETPFFAGSIGTVTAYTGQALEYHLNSNLFAVQNLVLTLNVPLAGRWLRFDPTNVTLEGLPPTAPSASSFYATLTAKTTGAAAQSQIFTVDVQATSTRSIPSSPRSSSTNTTTSIPRIVTLESSSHAHLSGGEIAAIVLLTLLGTGLVLFAAIICLRRRRSNASQRSSPTPSKADISRPILQDDQIRVTTEMQTDVEKGSAMLNMSEPTSVPAPAPQLLLSFPSRSTMKRGPKWLKRLSRVSQASSLGNGEEAIRRDSNIPEPGRESTMLHTPHDSFSIPAQLAIVTREQSRKAERQKGLKRLRHRQEPRRSIGLGIDLGMSGAIPRHTSKRKPGHKRSNHSMGRSGTLKSDSAASVSTRGTSLLSTKAADFPDPPIQSSQMLSAASRSRASQILDAKRRSIKVVDEEVDRVDERPMSIKRQSFIRNRASFGIQSPLFAHGSRASSNDTRQTGQRSLHGSSISSNPVFRRNGRNVLSTTYSASSSIDPTISSDSRRYSARVRNPFAPNFPRPIQTASSSYDDDDDMLEEEDELEAVAVDRDSSFYTTDSSLSDDAELVAQLALPRHQRTWVLPGEASPTPPPGAALSMRGSSTRLGSSPLAAINLNQLPSRCKDPTTSTDGSVRVSRWAHAPSPRVIAIDKGVATTARATGKASKARRSRISEPLSLVATDSISRGLKSKQSPSKSQQRNSSTDEDRPQISQIEADGRQPPQETNDKAGMHTTQVVENQDEAELTGTGLTPEDHVFETGTGKSGRSGMVFL